MSNEKTIKSKSTCLFVGADISDDGAVLLVGESSPGVDIKIINKFHGEEAIELYEKLIGKKEETK